MSPYDKDKKSDDGSLHSLTGQVVSGKKLGRRLGMPTANLAYPEGREAPQDGVYVAALTVLDDVGCPRYEGVLSQGHHPTAPGGPPTVEVHLFDCDADLYGHAVRVDYLCFLRRELLFDSLDAMMSQITQDVAQAKSWHTNRKDRPNDAT